MVMFHSYLSFPEGIFRHSVWHINSESVSDILEGRKETGCPRCKSRPILTWQVVAITCRSPRPTKVKPCGETLLFCHQFRRCLHHRNNVLKHGDPDRPWPWHLKIALRTKSPGNCGKFFAETSCSLWEWWIRILDLAWHPKWMTSWYLHGIPRKVEIPRPGNSFHFSNMAQAPKRHSKRHPKLHNGWPPTYSVGSNLYVHMKTLAHGLQIKTLHMGYIWLLYIYRISNELPCLCMGCIIWVLTQRRFWGRFPCPSVI